MISSSLRFSDYKYLAQYRCPLVYYVLCQSWVDAEMGKRFGFPTLDGRILFLDGHLFLYQSDWDELVRFTRASLERHDETFFRNLFACLEEVKARTLEASEALADPDDATRACERFFAAVHRLEFPWFVLLPVAEACEQIIREELTCLHQPVESLQFFLGVARPTLFMQHRQGMKDLRRQLDALGLREQSLDVLRVSAPDAYRQVQEHVRKFSWVGMMHFWGTPLTEERCLEELRAEDRKEEETPTQEMALGNDTLTWLRAQALELSYWRQHVAEVCSMASLAFRRAMESWGKDAGLLSYEDSLWLTPKEFLQALRGQCFPRAMIEERARAYGMYLDEGAPHVIVGEDLQKLLETFFASSETHVSVLKGMTACQGKATGRAKIVRFPDEMQKMNDGDILVAPETTPDLMPAIHKAAAIVTDMGGITSHAAIVSREFGIPCIVGTQNATRMIHDGDTIEVNADAGTVSILEPASV